MLWRRGKTAPTKKAWAPTCQTLGFIQESFLLALYWAFHLLIRLREPFLIVPIICKTLKCWVNTCPTREGRRNPLGFGICMECWVNTCPTCESRRNPLSFGICERVEAWARKTFCKGFLASGKLRCICYLENSEGSPRKSIALGVDVGKCWPNHLKLRCHLSNSISLTFQYIFILVEIYALCFMLYHYCIYFA